MKKLHMSTKDHSLITSVIDRNTPYITGAKKKSLVRANYAK